MTGKGIWVYCIGAACQICYQTQAMSAMSAPSLVFERVMIAANQLTSLRDLRSSRYVLFRWASVMIISPRTMMPRRRSSGRTNNLLIPIALPFSFWTAH